MRLPSPPKVPGKRNPVAPALCRALVDALEDAARAPAVGVILLTANGRAFCAGMDVAEIEEGSHAEEIDALHERLFTIGARLGKPLIRSEERRVGEESRSRWA